MKMIKLYSGIPVAVSLLLILIFSFSYSELIEYGAVETGKSIYDFEVTDIDGNNVKMDKYMGKVMLIVNVATNWGLANTNYNQMQSLYEKYSADGLAVLAFPCNQFAGQEPGTDAEIKERIHKKYNVTFDLFHKINVNGNSALPLYTYLKDVTKTWFSFGLIKWNFTKFLVSRDGKKIIRYEPPTSPNSFEPEIRKMLGLNE